MSVAFNSKSSEMRYSNLEDDGGFKHQRRCINSERLVRPAAVCSILMVLSLLIIILIFMAQSTRTNSAQSVTQVQTSEYLKSQCVNLTTQWIQLQNKCRSLDKEMDALKAERDIVSADRDCLRAERDALKPERDALRNEKDACVAVRDTLKPAKDKLEKERDALRGERDTLKPAKDKLEKERDALRGERDALKPERDALIHDRDACVAVRDTLQPEKDKLEKERDALRAERDALKPLVDGKDVCVDVHDALKPEKDQLEKERDALSAERDALKHELDQMRESNKNMTDEMEVLRTRYEDLLKNKPEALNVTGKVCPDQWVEFENSCYYLSEQPKRWLTSKRECELQNAYLVIINSAQENKFVSKFFEKIWIGLSDRENEDKWKWVNGDELGDDTYWGSGEPNDADSNEDCAELLRDSKEWNDVPCGRSISFVCEM